jgi:hypothetical protein
MHHPNLLQVLNFVAKSLIALKNFYFNVLMAMAMTMFRTSLLGCSALLHSCQILEQELVALRVTKKIFVKHHRSLSPYVLMVLQILTFYFI